MDKLVVLVIALMLVAFTSAQFSSKGGNCPLKNTVTICNPSCVNDYQCSGNSKCCPNKCGHKSCARSSAVSTGSGHKEREVLCAGVKCTRWEKCELDRMTKRQKCVRA